MLLWVLLPMLLVQPLMGSESGVPMAGLIWRTINFMTSDTRTTFYCAVVLLVKGKYRAKDSHLAKVTAKTRPKIVPFATSCRDVGTGNILEPVPYECNNMHVSLSGFDDTSLHIFTLVQEA